MMPGAEYPMVHGPAASAATSSPHSPWRSPVPYLYGGLAAMLGLIALSLLALACTYWKFSAGPVEEEAGAESRDGGGKGSVAGPAGEWQGLVVVIMAVDERPTFLATLASSRAAADGTTDAPASCAGSSEEGKIVECEASTQPVGSEDQVQSRSERIS